MVISGNLMARVGKPQLFSVSYLCTLFLGSTTLPRRQVRDRGWRVHVPSALQVPIVLSKHSFMSGRIGFRREVLALGMFLH